MRHSKTRKPISNNYNILSYVLMQEIEVSTNHRSEDVRFMGLEVESG